MAYTTASIPYPRYVDGVLQPVPFSIPANGVVAYIFKFDSLLAGLRDPVLATYNIDGALQNIWPYDLPTGEPLAGGWFMLTERGEVADLLLHPELAFAIYWALRSDSPPFYGVFYNSQTALVLKNFYSTVNAAPLTPFGLYAGPLEPVTQWILDSGFWNDQGVWIDSSPWKDSP